MKIGILNFPLRTNFGGILQSFALQTILERKGHEVEVLYQSEDNCRYPHKSYLMPLVYAKRILHNICSKNKIAVFFEHNEKRNRPIIRQNTDRFLSKYLKHRDLLDFSDITKSDYDAIIVGSDQVWRLEYFQSSWGANISNAFLSFTKGWDIKRIAYAASFGVDFWEYNDSDTLVCAEAAKTFDAISVREDSGVDLCRERLGVEATHVLDPTLLLSKDDYMKLVSAANTPQSPGNMLCYILDQTAFKTEVINRISATQHLTPFNVNAQVDNSALPVEQRIQPPLEAWLRGFYDAKFVVTDSFHACVFSIIFGKPFIAIGNASRGMTRFTSLLRLFGLESRLITESHPDLPADYTTLPDLSSLLEKYRNASHNFLDSNLK